MKINYLCWCWVDNFLLLVPGSTESLIDHFKGCMRSLKFYHSLINLLEPQSEPALSGYTHNIQAGCHSDEVCSDNPCPINSYCVDEWNLFTCLCEEGWQVSALGFWAIDLVVYFIKMHECINMLEKLSFHWPKAIFENATGDLWWSTQVQVFWWNLTPPPWFWLHKAQQRSGEHSRFVSTIEWS